MMRLYIGELAHSVEVENPDRLASTLAILLEGSIVTSQVFRRPERGTNRQACRQNPA